MNLSNYTEAKPSHLYKGDIVFYADSHALDSNLVHLLQVTKVVSVTSQSVILDNGRKFSLESGEEITRSAKGVLYEYTRQTIAMVNEAQAKLSLLNDVEAIDFGSLSSQQLCMIKDVARGAFTQLSNPAPCGGCSDSVEVSGLDIELDPARVAASFKVFDTEPTEVSATIGFNDSTYELTLSEVDALHEADDEDELEDRIASGHTA